MNGVILASYIVRMSATPMASKRRLREYLGPSQNPAIEVNPESTPSLQKRIEAISCFKLKLHSIVELVLYAVRNEIVHVQLPAVVLRGPQPGNGRADVALQGPN